ncbi:MULTISPECIES: DNA replication/repair protein RecF [Actinotignum]|uniref:DNA replication and repair protein RecF n=1 Tax=Actinotignum schaalii FB123-CNA-2 TaxID=883067 RepID=S2VK68_9ACTO|nr:DNA replication/repair protein RecF [Actinotignum schaalii]EPD27853.1 DNA replication and repair protein RecF [Actinotignum schaalii FB123-CNA-2]MDK6787357.1 DNA replication/repair protein RecF [Actinotignum timonense]
MYISDLALADFRNYRREVARFRPGVTILVGENGQGKTNLVEAIAYLATLTSHRVSSDNALIRQGATAGVVQARVVRGESPTTVEVEIYAGRANRARLNRGNVRPIEILGTIRAVLFAPEDLSLVRGEPAVRRAFLDDLMVQLRPRLASVKSEYERVIRQRAALLKTAGASRRRGQAVDHAAIDVWDEQLAALAAQIVAARAELVARLRPYVTDMYNIVSGNRGHARLDYAANAWRGTFALPDAAALLNDAAASCQAVTAQEEALRDVETARSLLRSQLDERRDQEIERGVNLVGPHRDDLRLSLGTLPAKGYASHGESWSYALALRLACWKLLSEDSEPILLLDDVFAELDARRRERLAELVAQADQVIVTAAVGDDLPESLRGDRLHIAAGSITGELRDGALTEEANGSAVTEEVRDGA